MDYYAGLKRRQAPPRPMPVDEEVILNKKDFIVSRTDLKGNITEVSDAFCKISGYKSDELIGQPHSIVRHIDMPKIAFEGLWNTINGSKIWNGIVKNSTKEGGFYWVNATIFPSPSFAAILSGLKQSVSD